MSDFAATWTLIRQRFDDAVSDLTHEQLNWRIHDGALTLGEMAIHVAGVEISFISQMLDKPVEGDLERVRAAATDGSVNDLPFPFTPDEISPEFVKSVLATAYQWVQPVITELTDELRQKPVKSALGPMTDGTGAMARIAYHPGYHQGQAYLIRTAPGFPKPSA